MTLLMAVYDGSGRQALLGDRSIRNVCPALIFFQKYLPTDCVESHGQKCLPTKMSSNRSIALRRTKLFICRRLFRRKSSSLRHLPCALCCRLHLLWTGHSSNLSSRQKPCWYLRPLCGQCYRWRLQFFEQR